MEDEIINGLISGKYAFWVWDEDGCAFECTTRFYEIWGYSKPLKPERPDTIIDNVHPDDFSSLIAQINEATRLQGGASKMKH
jgi:hypothetical protein